MSEVKNLKQYCLSISNTRINDKIFYNKRLKNYKNKFKSLITMSNN